MLTRVCRCIALLPLILALNAVAGLRVGELRCEYLENPLGIDTSQPRLSWILDSTQTGPKQTAYQILVASSPGELNKNDANLWDSGKVNSDQTTFITYAGKPLSARQACFWKVRS